MEGQSKLLQRLPEELFQDVVNRLEWRDLASLNLVSRVCHRFATPLLWRDVTLVDCRTVRGRFDDHHDDTQLLRKLVVIAQNEWIGSCVHTLTHQCHLPPPALFQELPKATLSGQTLSADPRTARLVQLAVKNMTNVQTLRIIFGHPNINDILLRCFFDKNRRRSIRRLWLENCRISAGCSIRQINHFLQLPFESDFTGLESIRLRRLPVRPANPLDKKLPFDNYVYARDTWSAELQDGAGDIYRTTINASQNELELYSLISEREAVEIDPVEAHLEFANQCDDRIFENLGNEAALPSEVTSAYVESYCERSNLVVRGRWLDPNPEDLRSQSLESKVNQREHQPSSQAMIECLHSCSTTLTSLCLDWIFTMPYDNNLAAWDQTFLDLFALRFPNLKAFQFRNAIVPDAVIPAHIYLLGYSKVHSQSRIIEEDGDSETSFSSSLDLSGLEFMEAHPNLQCLAWPMDSFFPITSPPSDIAGRVEAVIDNLGRTLVDLRVDTIYNPHGEPQSENYRCPNRRFRERRRKFISDFAAKMSKVQSIKIEGGVPRDERREVVRALHKCPLEKIVMIGVCCPIGNTWGLGARDLNETFDSDKVLFLEAEDKDVTHSLGFKKLEPPNANFRFEPTYGWPPEPPMIHTIASLHVGSIRELKFCGWKGAPVLFAPTPITHPLLAALKHYHNLESLIMSMWLNTEFEEAHRDSDIIRYWLEARSPTSTSLVRITDEEPEGWEKELRTKYAPDALAWWITSFVGQFLSEQAKARKNGVHVRISMVIGDGGIFDIDLRIGKGSLKSDVCLGYKGPREELELDRRRVKLENRRWF